MKKIVWTFGLISGGIVADHMRAEGASASEIAAASRKMAQFRKLYDNPLFNALITFLEIFPADLIMTLVSAAMLRRKTLAAA